MKTNEKQAEKRRAGHTFSKLISIRAVNRNRRICYALLFTWEEKLESRSKLMARWAGKAATRKKQNPAPKWSNSNDSNWLLF